MGLIDRKRTHPSEEQTFEDIADCLSLEGLYDHIMSLCDGRVEHYSRIGDFVDSYLNSELGNDAGEQGSEWYNELYYRVIEMWEKGDEPVYDYWNHGQGSTISEYQTIITFRRFLT